MIQLLANSIVKKDQTNFLEKTLLLLSKPVRWIVMGASEKVASAFDDYVFVLGQKKQNALLNEKNKQLELRVIQLLEMQEQNKRLKELLFMKEEQSINIVGTSVQSVGLSPFQKVIQVNQGQNQGVNVGDPVLASSGVVGQVLKVFSNSSDVLLLTDSSSYIDVINERTRERFLLKGFSENELTFEYLSIHGDLQMGDRLISSGFDQVYPKGFSVGHVVQIGQNDKRMFKKAWVKPTVEFGKIEDLGIVISNSIK